MKKSLFMPEAVQHPTWTSISGGFGHAVRGYYLILAGMDFRPYRISGDKNFWYYLITYLIDAGITNITIISMESSSNIRQKTVNYYQVGKGVVCLRHLPSAILNKYTNRAGPFPLGWTIIERIISLQEIVKEIRGINEAFGVSNLHLMDNFGPTTQLLAYLLPNPISVSAIAKNGRRPLEIQKRFSQVSFIHPRVKVVAYTHAYQDQLKDWGIKRSVHIPWGAETASSFPTLKEKQEAKKVLGLDASLPLYLWAGYIQQIIESDFLLAVAKAQEALAQGLKATFFFAFKPVSYQDKFAHLNQPEKGIIVQKTSVDQFLQLLLAADIFYSPFLNKKHIIGPPLTWIEMMAKGVPILTTAVGGVEEMVIEGETGWIAAHPEDIPKTLLSIDDSYCGMRRACYEKVRQDRSLAAIAKQYLQLWFGDKHELSSAQSLSK